MKALLLTAACLFAGFPAMAVEQPESAPEKAVPAGKTAPARAGAAAAPGGEPLVSGRIPQVRVVVADSRNLEPEVEAESSVLRGREMRQIIEVSRHKGNYLQLYLYRPAWRDPILFQPGIYVPLESEAQRRRKQAAAEAALAAQREAEAAGEEAPDETGGRPVENP